ncbi:MAG: (Fe-S)-binding protein [Candidatus Jordarchaeaceae archaeon]
MRNELIDYVKICMECRCKYCKDLCIGFIETRDIVCSPYGFYNLLFSRELGLIELDRKFAERLYYCTMCGFCKYRCTTSLCTFYKKIVDTPFFIRKIRSHLVESNLLPISIGRILENLKKFNNPMGVSQDYLKQKAREGKTLFYIGESRYDERNSRAANSAINILKLAKIDFGILDKEVNSGHFALMLGDVGLFEELKEKNLSVFEKFEEIITFSPHDFYTFREDYKLENVRHLVSVLEELVSSGRIKVEKTNEVYIYKDPCYLGRYMGIFDEPRNLIESIAKTEEFYGNRFLALCCGGGSAHAWLNLKKKRRAASILAAEAEGRTVITACPICTTMLEGENLRVLNIAEALEKVLKG